MKNLNELVEKHEKKIQIRSKLFLLKLKNITIENEVERVISNELKNQLNDLSKAMNEAYYLGQNKINNSDNSDINSIKKQKLSNVKRLSNTRSNPITSFVEMCCKNL